MKRILFGVFLVTSQAFAQEDTLSKTKPELKDRFLIIELGDKVDIVKDDMNSPVAYTGGNFGYDLSFYKYKGKHQQEFFLHGVIGRVKTSQFAPQVSFGSRFKQPAASLYRFELGYDYLHEFKEVGKYKVLLGGRASSMTNVRYNTRWDNSAISWDQIFGVYLKARAVRGLKLLKKDMLLSYDLMLPVMMYNIREPYTGVPDFINPNTGFFNDLFEEGRIGHLFKTPRVKSQLNLSYATKWGSRLGLTYFWDFYAITHPHLVQSAEHGFMLSFKVAI